MKNFFTTILFFTVFHIFLGANKIVAQSWSPELKTVFIQNCVTGFKQQANGNENVISAEDYCECAYNKIQSKYTMLEFAQIALKGDITQNTEIQELMLSCFSEKSNVKIIKPTFEISEKAQKNGWSTEYQTIFLSSCIGMAKSYDQNDLISSLFDVDAYCNCSLQKISEQFNVLETTKESFFMEPKIQTIMIECLFPTEKGTMPPIKNVEEKNKTEKMNQELEKIYQKPNDDKAKNFEDKSLKNDVNGMNTELENFLKQQENKNKMTDEQLPKTWTPTFEAAFIEGCKKGIQKKDNSEDMTINNPKEFCECLLEKIKPEFTPTEIFDTYNSERYKNKISLFTIQCLDK